MTTIYALKDPRDGKIKYVGRTVNPRRRLAAHRANLHSINAATKAWAAELRALEMKAQLVELETCRNRFAVRAEATWIHRLISDGEPLMNRLLPFTDERGHVWFSPRRVR